MSDFIATLGPKLAHNWDVCKREGLWGIVGKGTNWRSNGQRVRAGDRIFVWRSKPNNGFIAQMEALGPMTLTGSPGVPVPWESPDRFGGVFPMRVIAELAAPESDRFLDVNHRIGVRFGFSGMALQHIFEEISPEIAGRVAAVFPTVPSTACLGVPYVAPPPPGPVAASQPFDIDPNAVDRGLLAHHDTVEALAAWVRLNGWQPLLPALGEPLYDLAWISDGVINVAEIKSTTADNREMQLRLGLGQVIRYRQHLSGRTKKVKAWLVAENDVPDSTWASACTDVGVKLTWPSVLPDPARIAPPEPDDYRNATSINQGAAPTF